MISTFRAYWLFFLGYQLHGLIWRDDNTIALPDDINLAFKVMLINVTLINIFWGERIMKWITKWLKED